MIHKLSIFEQNKERIELISGSARACRHAAMPGPDHGRVATAGGTLGPPGLRGDES